MYTRSADTTRDITFTIPETLEIIREPGSATSQCIIMATYNTGILNIYGIKKRKKKKNLGQQRRFDKRNIQ